MVFKKTIFNIFSKVYPFCCPGNQSKSAIKTKITLNVEDYSINMSVFFISPLRQKKINFHFSHYKSMENISCHSNQSSYPTGKEDNVINTPKHQLDSPYGF